MDPRRSGGEDARMSAVVGCEVCVDSLQGVRAAAEGGADRIELCSALELGGLTPSLGLLRAARRATGLPIFAMVRLRAGDFVHAAEDLDQAALEVAALRAGGADGIVFGALTPDGGIDTVAVAAVQGAARGLPITFHRAVDCAVDPVGAVEVLCGLGLARVLTSGGAAAAPSGAATIAAMVERAGGRIDVMAGAGLRAANVAELVAATGVAEVHLSAARVVPGPARFVNPACGFAAPGRGDAERRETSAAEVRAVLRALGRS
jgi:copper homeostasis protein